MRTGQGLKPWRQVAAAIVSFLPFVLLHGAAAESKYRGFTIDESRVRDLAGLAEFRAATKEQIDIVCAVGVPAEILEFFRSVPFNLVSASAVRSRTPGLYQGRARGVEVTSGIVTTGHKPVLLHELLHAYHDQRLPEGFRNREIIGFYERAKSLGVFAANSHMMSNEKEYFACSATTYLFGVTAQEPFARSKVREGQPVFFAYLKSLFGAAAGDYAGSLTR